MAEVEQHARESAVGLVQSISNLYHLNATLGSKVETMILRNQVVVQDKRQSTPLLRIRWTQV